MDASWNALLAVYAQKTGRSGREALSPHTTRSVSTYLRAFLTECGLTNSKPGDSIGDDLCRALMNWLSARDMKRSSRHTVITILCEFFSASMLLEDRHKKILTAHFSYRNEDSWSKYNLTGGDIQVAILHVLRLKGSHPYTRIRDAAILCTLGTIGIRVSSIVELRMGQIEVTEVGWKLSVTRKKGTDKNASVKPVPRAKMFGAVEIGWILDAFMEQRQTIQSDYLFPTESGQMLAVRDLQRKLAATAQATGIDRLNPHALRHHAITRIAAKAGILQAQIVADHSRIQTTQLYINKESPEFDISNAVL